MQSREVQLIRRPDGVPSREDFRVVESSVADPGDGEVTVRNICLSVDPYMRGRMTERESYVASFGLNETLTGGAIGRVARSRTPDFEEGDIVESFFGWREAFTADAGELRRIGNLAAPPSAYLGVLGMPGLTAYVGLFEIGSLRPGADVVYVSGAAGAVGSAVGQIAKVKGCRAVGSAGGADKVRHLVEDLHFNHAFDYRDGHLAKQIRAGAPDGVDVYFDNVGGAHLQAGINCMRKNGRIVLCGMIAHYNALGAEPGPNNLIAAIGSQLTLRGFIVSNYYHLHEKFLEEMSEWVRSGDVTYRETVFNGIESMPDAFIGLFSGLNTGKMIVSLE